MYWYLTEHNAATLCVARRDTSKIASASLGIWPTPAPISKFPSDHMRQVMKALSNVDSSSICAPNAQHAPSLRRGTLSQVMMFCVFSIYLQTSADTSADLPAGISPDTPAGTFVHL